jgi:hypothetical protein
MLLAAVLVALVCLCFYVPSSPLRRRLEQQHDVRTAATTVIDGSRTKGHVNTVKGNARDDVYIHRQEKGDIRPGYKDNDPLEPAHDFNQRLSPVLASGPSGPSHSSEQSGEAAHANNATIIAELRETVAHLEEHIEVLEEEISRSLFGNLSLVDIMPGTVGILIVIFVVLFLEKVFEFLHEL